MEFGNEIEFLRNKTILVTGATGFLAKVVVEKILRVQPNVKKMYLLIRSKETKSIHERLYDQIIGKELFRVVRERQGVEFESFVSEKVVPIDGDTSLINLGLKNNRDIYNEIDVIIHSAAVVGFKERYDLSFGINTLGAINVLNFAKCCPNLQILVHVSTAYVSKKKAGLIQETPCKLSDEASNGTVKLDIDAEKQVIDKTLEDLKENGASIRVTRDAMKRLGHKRAKLYGWSNAYVFTKAMGEMLIWENKGDLPVVIVRPTMISSTYKEPFPGWIQGTGSVGILTVIYGKGLTQFTHADVDSVCDLIPVDMVANAIIAAAVANANKPGLTIYQVGSSLRNRVTLNKLIESNYQYFNDNPWIDDQGTPLKSKRRFFVKGQLHYLMLLALLLLKLLVLKFMDIALRRFIKVNNQDKIAMQLTLSIKVAMMYRHYAFFSGIFVDENTEKLRKTMSEKGIDEEGFNFDPRCIDWEDYLLNNHIPAVVKYAF